MSDINKAILLVEDNEDDVFLMKRALKEARVTWPLHVATDGREAVNYLSGTGKYHDRTIYPLPRFVFLDLKLPYKSGFEVFCWIREQPQLRQSVIIILTSSPEPGDREMARELGAHAYLVKPPTSKILVEIFSAKVMPNEATAHRRQPVMPSQR